MNRNKRPDVTVERSGGLFLLKPRTPAGEEWMAAKVRADRWQLVGGALITDDRRFAWDIVQAMQADGLIVTDPPDKPVARTTVDGETLH